jgi:hypothetical protein
MRLIFTIEGWTLSIRPSPAKRSPAEAVLLNHGDAATVRNSHIRLTRRVFSSTSRRTRVAEITQEKSNSP